MPKATIYIESITTVKKGVYDIRIWRKQKPGYDNTDNLREIKEHVDGIAYVNNIEKLAMEVLKLKSANAVEVKYTNEVGIVLYKNWP